MSCPSPSTWASCRPWELVNDKAQCLMDQVAGEQLNIAGAVVNLFKLLGVHEQTLLTDLTGNGTAISGGNAQGRPASLAFSTTTSEWRSLQGGSDAILASAYIGYDFGEVKISNGRKRYGIQADVRKHITTIKIKQGTLPASRATKARVERSDNGTQWYGVAIITLPDNDALNTVHFKQSVPSRYWRIRPLEFSGTDCDTWVVQALELHDYSSTRLDNIQDKILMENRARDYASEAMVLKGYYDIQAPQTELSMFGATIPVTYTIRIHFTSCIATLGRPVVVGDIIELPSETQYTADMRPIKRFLEVTDVTWDATSYTPGWQPLLLQVTAQPAMAAEETQDIFGDLAKNVDSSGVFDIGDGNHPVWQDISDITHTIKNEAATAVPERGSEGSNTIREFEDATIAQAAAEGVKHLTKYGFNRTGLYVEDAIPQNGAPYTEGTTLPPTASDGDYHRLTYEGLSKDIPARLYRYSTTKGGWIYLETDRRYQYNNQKTTLEEYLLSPNATPADTIK
jgi:hypothetical protein